jgi:hypothetical protein
MKAIGTTLALGALALGLSTAFTVPDADARDRRVSGKVQTQRGTTTVQRDTMREPGMRTRSTSATGPKGRTTSATETRTRDREAGTATRDRDRTYADGTTRSVDSEVQRTGEGTYATSRTVTGRDGETRTQTGDFTRTKTEDGASVSGAIQTQNNGVVDYQRDVTRGDGSRAVTSSSTFEDGTSIARSSATSRDAATGVRTTTGSVTNRQGETTTTTSVRTPTENGATVARDTTFADGTTRSVDRNAARDGEGGATVDRTVTGRGGKTRTQTGVFTSEPLPPN